MKKVLIILISFLWMNLWAKENRIKIEVSGLVCEFCAKGLERSFLKGNLIKNIIISLEEGTVILELFDHQEISNQKITQLINDNGISVDKIIRNF